MHASFENLQQVQGRIELKVRGGSLALMPDSTLAMNDPFYGILEGSIQLTAQLRDVLGARFVQSPLPTSCTAQGGIWQS